MYLGLHNNIQAHHCETYANSIINLISVYALRICCPREERSTFICDHLEQPLTTIKQLWSYGERYRSGFEQPLRSIKQLYGHMHGERYRSGFEQPLRSIKQLYGHMGRDIGVALNKH